jgi:hypothetical protein
LEGKTPEISIAQARDLFALIGTTDAVTLRDRRWGRVTRNIMERISI